MVSSSTSFHSELREVETSRLLSTKSGQNFQSFFFWSLVKESSQFAAKKLLNIKKNMIYG